MTISYTQDDVTVRSDEQCLAEVDTAIHAILTTGQSYTIFGSRVVNRSSLDSLERLKAKYEKRILSRKGWTGRNHLDHSAADVPTSEIPE